MIYVYPYNQYSESCKNLGYTRIKLRNSKFRNGRGKYVINWGNGDCPYDVTFNQPSAVRNAVNKLVAFRIMANAGVSVPPFTANKAEARGYGGKVVVRKLLSSSEGKGISIENSNEELSDAPLYVKYIPKKWEFRVHVVRGKIIDVQRKVLKQGIDTTTANFNVRNTANGFIFQRNGITVPDSVNEEAIKAVAALGLDFGGVDVVWNEKGQKAYVLEVNTAPGIEGTTVTNYKNAFEKAVS